MEAGYGWNDMKLRKILLLLTAAALYTLAAYFCSAAKEDATRTYLLLSEPIHADRAEDIFEQEASLADPMSFCFWGEQEKQWIACKETGGIAEVTQIFLSGNTALLDAPELIWQEGCYLDRSTAQTLFGTADCSRQTLWQNDHSYRVFQTISRERPTMIVPASEVNGAVLNRCVLDAPTETGTQTARQFLLRWGLSGEIIEFYPLWVAVHNLPVILPGIHLLIWAVQQRKRSKLKFGIALSLCLLLCSQIRILPDMIPTRWSDFSFWGIWWEAQIENIQLVLMTPMGERHLQMMLNMVKSIICSTAAFAIMLWTLRRQNHANTAD